MTIELEYLTLLSQVEINCAWVMVFVFCNGLKNCDQLFPNRKNAIYLEKLCNLLYNAHCRG